MPELPDFIGCAIWRGSSDVGRSPTPCAMITFNGTERALREAMQALRFQKQFEQQRDADTTGLHVATLMPKSVLQALDPALLQQEKEKAVPIAACLLLPRVYSHVSRRQPSWSSNC